MTQGYFVGPCYRCKCEMWLPTALYESAKRTDRITFYCPYGHGQVFREGDSEETILRRERDKLQQQIAYKDDLIRAAEQRVSTAEDIIKRQRKNAVAAAKRTKAGLCPCCNRSFRQMALHMKSKHPEFKAEEAA